MPFFEGSTIHKLEGGTFTEHGQRIQTTNNQKTYNSYGHGSTLNNGYGSYSNEELQRFLTWERQVSSSTPSAAQSQAIDAQARPQIAYKQPGTPGSAVRGRIHEQPSSTGNRSYLSMDTQQDFVSQDQYEHVARDPPMSRSQSPQCASPLTNSVHTLPSSRISSPPPICANNTEFSAFHRENPWNPILEEPEHLSEEPSEFDRGRSPLRAPFIPRPHSTRAAVSQPPAPLAHASSSRAYIDTSPGDYQVYQQNTIDTQGLPLCRSRSPPSRSSETHRTHWGNVPSAVSQPPLNMPRTPSPDTFLSGPAHPRLKALVPTSVQDTCTTQTAPSAPHASSIAPPQRHQSQLQPSPAVTTASVPTHNPDLRQSLSFQGSSQTPLSDSSSAISVSTNIAHSTAGSSYLSPSGASLSSTAVTTPDTEPSPEKPFVDIVDPRPAHLPGDLLTPTTGPVAPTSSAIAPNSVVYLPPAPLDVFAAIKPLSDQYMTPVVEKKKVRKRDKVKNLLRIK